MREIWICQTMDLKTLPDYPGWDTLRFFSEGGHDFVAISKATKWKTLEGAIASVKRHIERRDICDWSGGWTYQLVNLGTGEKIPWEIFG